MSIPAEAEGMAGWIEVHPERITCRHAWLHCMLRCSERQHLGLDCVEIVDRYVEVELLRPFARRPVRGQTTALSARTSSPRLAPGTPIPSTRRIAARSGSLNRTYTS